MNQKEIKELIEFLVEKDIAEFELQRGDMKLLIKRGARAQPAPVLQVTPTLAMGHTAAVASAPAAPSSSTPSPTTDTGEPSSGAARSEEHTSELQSLRHLVCRLLLEK